MNGEPSPYTQASPFAGHRPSADVERHPPRGIALGAVRVGALSSVELFANRLLAACLLALALCGAAAAQDDGGDEPPPFVGGLVLGDPARYQAIPETPTFRSFLPESVDLSERFPRAGNQGSQGSCAAWAVGYAARSYYVSKFEGRSLADRGSIPSPAYIYNAVKEPGPGCNTGSLIENVLLLLQNGGASSLATFPYDQKTCSPPTPQQKEAASEFRIDGFRRVDLRDLDQIKGELAQGNPVVIGMMYGEGLTSLKAGEIYSRGRGRRDDGHAVTLVGYDERKRAFKFINSWGRRWAENGFGLLGYDFFAEGVDQAFVLRIKNTVPAPQPNPAPIVPPGPPPEPTPEPSPLPQPGPIPGPDAIVPNLPTVGCGLIRLSPDRRSLTGFVGKTDEFELVRGFAETHHLANAVELRPWPQCEALLTLAGALDSPDAPGIVGDPHRPLHEGEYFGFEVDTPRYESYLQIAYIQADGTVVNLSGSSTSALRQFRPHSRVVLGLGADGGPKFKVSSPFGNEMLLAVASQSPLFPTPLPRVATEREFLTALRAAILLRSPNGPVNGDIAASYIAISTQK